MKPGLLKQWVFKVLYFFSRGKPEWACLGTGGLGVIILHEVVPGLRLCIGAFVRRGKRFRKTSL